MKHPIIKYGKAIALIDNEVSNDEELQDKDLLYSLELNSEYFRVIPTETFNEKSSIKYQFDNNQKATMLKDLPKHGIFLAPNVIAKDGNANGTWGKLIEIKKSLNSKKNKTFDALLSITSVSGDYIKFSERGGSSKTTQKLTKDIASMSMIALITPFKPCMQYRIEKGVGKQPDLLNTAIVPDLPIDKLIDFIKFFKDILSHKSSRDLLIGKVEKVEKSFVPKRPALFYGNFPNAPRSSAFGGIALLAAIGEFTKEAEYSERAKGVLDDLKDTAMYMIKYGDANIFTYNHYVIDIAKTGRLRRIVDSVYYSILFKSGNRNRKHLSKKEKNELTDSYQKFDLYAARFLQLFNAPSFKDFLSFRAEYPYQLEILFNTYFIKMEKIDSKIVASARQFGKWLNQVAYFTAKAEIKEIKEDTPDYWEKLREVKAKVLIELESAAFSAKSGDALMAQVITRAGRLSMMDAPSEADLFIQSTITGELTLEQSKNLVIAFSRLKNSLEKKESNELSEEILLENNNENYQNI